MKQNKTVPIPQYFDRLSDADKKEYFELQKQISNPFCKNRRNRSLEAFKNVINLIHSYVVRNDEGDKDRSLVCGALWLDSGIAINTHQLSIISGRCKSSINGGFQALGYGTIPSGADCTNEILSHFPFMKKNFQEFRQWTIRQKMPGNYEPGTLSQMVAKQINEIGQNNNISDNSSEYDQITPPEDLYQTGSSELSLTDYVKQLIKKSDERKRLQQQQQQQSSIADDEFQFHNNLPEEPNIFDGFFSLS